jgi:hypothetical protein
MSTWSKKRINKTFYFREKTTVTMARRGLGMLVYRACVASQLAAKRRPIESVSMWHAVLQEAKAQRVRDHLNLPGMVGDSYTVVSLLCRPRSRRQRSHVLCLSLSKFQFWSSCKHMDYATKLLTTIYFSPLLIKDTITTAVNAQGVLFRTSFHPTHRRLN